MEAHIRERAEALRDMPHVGVATGVGNYRWVRVRRTPYLLVYRVASDEVRIAAVTTAAGTDSLASQVRGVPRCSPKPSRRLLLLHAADEIADVPAQDRLQR